MAKDRKVVEAKIDEILSAKIKKNATARKEKKSSPNAGMPNAGGTDNPFAAFGGGGMPDLSAMAGMQGGKLPLKMRIMTKLAGLAMNPKFSRFLQKKWWPLWVVVGILLSGFIVIGAVFFLIWKMIKAIIDAYTDMFKKRS